jgi:hypothetical protein
VRILVIILLLTPLLTHAQNKLDFAALDRKTFELYQQENWNDLIRLGKLGLKSGKDYYYLRARLGVAYFMKGQYFFAASQFRKSLSFSQESSFSNEYLYYSLLYSGQTNESEKQKAKLLPSVKSKLNKTKFLKSLYFETGPAFSNSYDDRGQRNLMGRAGIYGESNLYGNNYYVHLGLNFNLPRGMTWYIGYSYLMQEKRNDIQFTTTNLNRVNTVYYDWGYEYIYARQVIASEIEYTYYIHQNELYSNLVIPIGDGWRIIPAFHLIHDSYSPLLIRYSPVPSSDTANYTYADSAYHTFNYLEASYSYKESDTSYYNYQAYLGIYKQWEWLNVGLSAAISNLDGRNQQQFGLTFTYYPVGSLDFYGQTVLQALFQDNSSQALVYQKVGMKIFNRTWLEFFMSYGDMSRMSEQYAFVVYNLVGKINYRLGTCIIFALGNHLELSLRYQFFDKESASLQFLSGQANDFHLNTVSYQTHQIIGGIKWIL